MTNDKCHTLCASSGWFVWFWIKDVHGKRTTNSTTIGPTSIGPSTNTFSIFPKSNNVGQKRVQLRRTSLISLKIGIKTYLEEKNLSIHKRIKHEMCRLVANSKCGKRSTATPGSPRSQRREANIHYEATNSNASQNGQRSNWPMDYRRHSTEPVPS